MMKRVPITVKNKYALRYLKRYAIFTSTLRVRTSVEIK